MPVTHTKCAQTAEERKPSGIPAPAAADLNGGAAGCRCAASGMVQRFVEAKAPLATKQAGAECAKASAL